MDNPLENSLKGQLLLAMPGLMDPNFAQTITLICEHGPSGAMGIILDRVGTSLFAKDIFNELGIPHQTQVANVPIHYGGPVHIDEIFIVHGPPFHWEGCLVVTDTIALSNTMDLLSAIAQGNGPSDFIISVGCSGWGGGQLESEMAQNAWLTCPAHDNIIFGIPAADQWKTAMNELGIDPDLLSNIPGHA